MKVFIVFATLLAVFGTATGVVAYLAITTPEPGDFSEQTILPMATLTMKSSVKLRVAKRDRAIMKDRIEAFLDRHDAEYHDVGEFKYVYRISTQDPAVAQALTSLDSHRDQLTPNYAGWPPPVNIARSYSLDDPYYNVRLKIRGIHHQPALARTIIAGGVVSFFLFICTALSGINWQVERERKQKNIRKQGDQSHA